MPNHSASFAGFVAKSSGLIVKSPSLESISARFWSFWASSGEAGNTAISWGKAAQDVAVCATGARYKTASMGATARARLASLKYARSRSVSLVTWNELRSRTCQSEARWSRNERPFGRPAARIDFWVNKLIDGASGYSSAGHRQSCDLRTAAVTRLTTTTRTRKTMSARSIERGYRIGGAGDTIRIAFVFRVAAADGSRF